MSDLNAIRDWLNFAAEWIIVYILILEFKYDKAKDDLKAQRKTRTSKKTTTGSGQTVTEEISEVTEPIKEDQNVGQR